MDSPPSWLVTVDDVLHFYFCLLPVLWMLSVLPPLDALFPWFCEQLIMHVFGGGPVSSYTSLLLNLGFSVMSAVTLLALNKKIFILVAAGILGYTLSTDISKSHSIIYSI